MQKIKDAIEAQLKVDLPEGENLQEMEKINPVMRYIDNQLELRQQLFQTTDLKKRLDIYKELMQ